MYLFKSAESFFLRDVDQVDLDGFGWIWVAFCESWKELHTVFLHTVEIKDGVDIGIDIVRSHRMPLTHVEKKPTFRKTTQDSDLCSVGALF